MGHIKKEKIKRINTIMLAILHGSRATGHNHQDSDWDVAVLADRPLTWYERSVLRRTFAAKLSVPDGSVDVADLRSSSPLLRYRAAMHGRLIEGDPREFQRFQISAWKDYLNNHEMFDLRAQFLTKTLS
jgi:predicted nucleotidyltransferase